MTALLTADWYPYGKNDYYRKVDVYEMGWQDEIKVDNIVMVAAKFGGPIAIIRDRMKPGGRTSAINSIGKPVISIYSAAGVLISSFLWNSGQLIRLCWSANEKLLCVQENGEILIYNIFGKYVHAFRMGQEVEDTKVIDANVFYTTAGTGICVLTGAYRLFLTNTIDDPKVRKLSEIPGVADSPNSWAIVCEERQPYVLLSKSTDLYYISENRVVQKTINNSDESRSSIITDISVSPCYEHVAMYNSQEQLWIGSSNLRKNYRLIDLHDSGRPKQLTWCGSEAVVGYWDNDIVIIGRNADDDRLKYVYDTPVKLIPEMDCIRVVSSYSTDIIQRVPKVILETYRIDSTSPGSYLLEASKQFNKKSHRANEYIHLVREELVAAINQCTEASSHEFNCENQKMLIRAAHFGKTFAENFDTSYFVRICRVLRILNAVRHPKIGIFLTYPQFEYLSFKNLLDRLILRRYYYVAIEAAKYMRLSNEDGSTKILEHWAYYKISQLETDKMQVAADIAKRLTTAPGISFTSIAKKALSYGRKELAVQLIEYEPQASLQVSTLLGMERYSLALEKAVRSGNTDLMSIVIVTMLRKMSLKDFQLEVRKESVVYALYKKYCKERNEETLINIYRQEDDNNEIANCHIRNAYDPKNFSTRAALLENAREFFKKAKNETNATLCDEQRKLMSKQKELSEKFNKKEFVDLSLQDTIYTLLMMKEMRIAEELRCIFHVSDRKYWMLRVESLSELQEWFELEKLSKMVKKPPIGYEPFVDACLKHNRLEAIKYVYRVKDENKIKYLTKAGLYRDAIELAKTQKDIAGLEYIRANCDTVSLLEVNSALSSLNIRS